MADLVERLRELAQWSFERFGDQGYIEEFEAAAARIEQLEIENIQMRFALGYPMPADLEKHVLPTNPFKCGTCDASAIRAARIEKLEAALHGVLNCIGNLDVDRLQYQMIREARAALEDRT